MAANCPACGKQIAKARLEKIDTDMEATQLSGPIPAYGFAYVCPNAACNKMLPIWPVPQEQK